MDDKSNAQPATDVEIEEGKRRTWPAGVPPLRLNRRAASFRVNPPAVEQNYDTSPPGYLRPLRALVGLVLLTIAWISLLAVVIVGQLLWRKLTSQRPLSFHLSLYALSLVATCWVAVVGVGCIVAGAFSLALAITRRGW